ncbi:phage tail protein [Vibrio sp. IB15]|uniref:phage tail protein n=1 Tax=Vibrio TaxID=662 RepID=UPI000CBA3FE1|nr:MULTISPECIES: phage tail protein [Vibrio]MBJ2148239.1 phage tail protein [Vibrio sp. IB15]PMG66761.1 hypothetical protein BCU86_12865 [Vibrio lentus]PMI81712.1 hypothetical protein BCU36_11725 [Vibrio lentus]PMJ00219.1 hypothetical protein BCU32_11980 [Vibrio lentus]
MTLAVTITHRGLAECISAKNTGIKAKIAKISVGDKSYKPSPSQVALRNERQIEDIVQCVNVSSTSLQMAAKFSGDEEFPIGEIALWLESGTLLGIVSEPNRTLTYKAKGSHVIVPFTMNFEALPSDSLTVVVGTENLNIMIEPEMMSDALAFVRSQTVQIKQAHNQIKVNDQLLAADSLIENLNGLLIESTSQLEKALSLVKQQTQETFGAVAMSNTQAHLHTQSVLVRQANNTMKSNEAIRKLESH